MKAENNNLVAVLGPTNTGKTYLAFERLLSYQSGIFGFPLRLLARENYDKAVKKIGINNIYDRKTNLEYNYFGKKLVKKFSNEINIM